MYIDIKGRIVVFENKKLVEKISKEIVRFNKRILKLGIVDGGIYAHTGR